MRKKDKECQEARRLRHEGKSIRKIARLLGVSQGSVSPWVRDIELTDEQKISLGNGSVRGIKMMKVWKAHQRNALEKRKKWQEEGREMARSQNIQFAMGCMLYWAEGSKSKNSVRFANSDVEMLKFFVRFLEECFGVESDDIHIRLFWYSGNGMTFEDATSYWIKSLGLKQSCLRKSQVDMVRRDSHGKKVGKLPYGTCHLSVDRTDVVQKIFGAIQEFCGFTNERWLMCK